MPALVSSIPTSADAPLAVDAREAARLLSISPRTLWTLTNRGELPCCRIGRRVTYRVADLHEFLASRVTKEGSANV